MFDVEAAWPDGPLREKRAASRFKASYVCQECRRLVDGVQRLLGGKKWLCSACLDACKAGKVAKG